MMFRSLLWWLKLIQRLMELYLQSNVSMLWSGVFISSDLRLQCYSLYTSTLPYIPVLLLIHQYSPYIPVLFLIYQYSPYIPVLFLIYQYSSLYTSTPPYIPVLLLIYQYSSLYTSTPPYIPVPLLIYQYSKDDVICRRWKYSCSKWLLSSLFQARWLVLALVHEMIGLCICMTRVGG